MNLALPDFVLVGASGSGKSMFATWHFLPTEVPHSDHLRVLVSGDETSQEVTGDAFLRAAKQEHPDHARSGRLARPD